ncbi:trypsin-like peptidase domain-containing protein [Zhouia spongiae]|uniref:Trypsin-like peptidase domain-containing protein n=1 Tax=Zhouia spongiae TaxID=2202721 RepID=A0ABY3YLE4_9FLAO|nr:trypsin-like peptidase domain-containing protein [Zhouia spongiae]UNY98600.1 trypsin-like peptidase domain-containing protein [Zhouia spongiae]
MSVLKSIESSVYRINTANGSGTGFYSLQDNVVVTNYHVVSGCLRVSIEGQDKNRYLAKVVYINQGKDIAFLQAEDLPEPAGIIRTNHDNETASRDKVLVLGYPYGMPFTVTEGIVSNPRQIIDGSNFIQTDAAINPGNSGGPVINEKGELVGIVTSKFTNADNMGFAIPTKTLREELEIVSELSGEFTIACTSCNNLIEEKTDYCPNCGNDIDEKLFEENQISDFSSKVEEAIKRLNVDPVLARTGRERWYFHQGSAEIRMFVYDNNYLFATSPLNDLPRKNLAEVYEYILTADMGKHRLSISNNQIFLSYRIHISDLYSENKEEFLEDIAQLAIKADDLDDMFVNDFGAKMTHYSKC